MPSNILKFNSKIRKIRSKLSKAGVDALLVSDKADILYLAGYYVPGVLVLILKNASDTTYKKMLLVSLRILLHKGNFYQWQDRLLFLFAPTETDRACSQKAGFRISCIYLQRNQDTDTRINPLLSQGQCALNYRRVAMHVKKRPQALYRAQQGRLFPVSWKPVPRASEALNNDSILYSLSRIPAEQTAKTKHTTTMIDFIQYLLWVFSIYPTVAEFLWMDKILP